MNNIAKDFSPGKNFSIGQYCVIESDVIVGDNVRIGHQVVLKSGTRFANDIDFADYCCTTGLCYVGNNVNIRTRSTISKGVIVEDRAFIGAGVMTSHTKHVSHWRPKMIKQQHITRIGMGAIIGSSVNIMAGIKIMNNVIVGYASNIVQDLLYRGIYVGNPAKIIVLKVSPEMMIQFPKDWSAYEFTQKLLKQYLPYV